MIDPKDVKPGSNCRIIAQHDDEDYSESGYVVASSMDGSEYAIGHYSHCSCYGTWDGDACMWEWEGDRKGLIEMARGGIDPDMPGRKAEPGDCDFSHLAAVYSEVLTWAAQAAEVV